MYEHYYFWFIWKNYKWLSFMDWEERSKIKRTALISHNSTIVLKDITMKSVGFWRKLKITSVRTSKRKSLDWVLCEKMTRQAFDGRKPLELCEKKNITAKLGG